MDQSHAAYLVGVDERHHRLSSREAMNATVSGLQEGEKKEIKEMTGAGLIQPDAGGSSCALSEGTGREVGMHPDYSPVFGSPLGLDSPTLRKCVAQEQRRQ